MTIIYTSIGFFALAALLGMYLLTFVLRGKETPKAIVFSHGPMAVVGVVLLLIYIFKDGPNPMESLILFILAAAGGVFMVYRDITNKPIPKLLAIGHGLLAVTGFVLLLIFAFQNNQ
jgi:peptidoglycan/LPS O-acetylase OafA/YrhL